MIDHLSFYATDYATSKAFYTAALKPLGYNLGPELTATWDTEFPGRRMCAFGPPGRSIFWLIEVKTPASPRHVAFTAKDRAAVDAFHQAALKTGVKDNGGPGERPHYHPHYYGAFVLDPDGNNIEAVYHGAP
ncbi:VOC family protein [Archangium minus]|uniref:VOC family protein n=1 Tax=Archangium minus TaxID=83450 RepID=A0ABY9WGZ1_9BACT|nr:VOC family protein [Archangium minus]